MIVRDIQIQKVNVLTIKIFSLPEIFKISGKVITVSILINNLQEQTHILKSLLEMIQA